MNNGYIDINEVSLIGTITDIITTFETPDGTPFTTATLLVQRTSGAYDYTTLTLPGTPDHYQINKKYLVEGQYRTYTREGHLEQRVYVKNISIVDHDTPDHNTFTFTGTLVTAKPYRLTPFGKTVGDIVVAVNSGTRTAYIPCVTWGISARYITAQPTGTRLHCKARVQSRPYKKTTIVDNEEVTTDRLAYEVSIMDMEVIDREQ